ncbi:hypothetical protein HCU74_15080 [Spongiibacter sp. KMU-166]|uniref:Hydroxyneurosporene synthase (CrtC) n=1 Tax=Spongiibacter thalassae TaxID=2721624 RepID=A0ABX1GIF5_9GAMM|nr:hypothetical protein [Spongiibacter thalassae]NKI18735.1 hypothetical protein [Spongiibacter thalassae]
MPDLTTEYMTENIEKLISNPDIYKWNQSYYFNFYDRHKKTGGFFRIGILENVGEVNCFAIFFRDGKPLFTRLNMNLPYTTQRLDPGITVAGITMKATRPQQTATVKVETEDFYAELEWDLIHPMGDSIALSKSGENDAIAKELTYVHPEGFCNVKGQIRLRSNETIDINDKGFRDLSVGPRNWTGLIHYRLAWPIFDNGVGCVAVHGITTQGDSYQKILHDGESWLTLDKIEEVITYEDDDIGFKQVHWKVWDEKGRLWDFTGKPLFRWMFPYDSFMFVEQMMEYTLADGTKGYGMAEGGFSFPWQGNGN